MKNLLLNWRFWLIAAQTCVALVLIIAEPVNDGSTVAFICRLVAIKAAGILLFAGVMAEFSLWRKYFPFINKMSE